MIRMLGMIDLPPVGMNKATFDEVIKQTESSLGLSEAGENEPHNKGDVWQTASGRWSGKSSDGYVRSFDDQAKAKEYASGNDNAHIDRDFHTQAKDREEKRGNKYVGGQYAPKTESHQMIKSLLRSPRLKNIVKEEYNKILEDCKKEAPKIEKKLEGMRSKMCEEFVRLERKGTFTGPAMEKRMQINTVAELIDVPVNELMLYFLNHVKTANEHKLVEYHLGHVYFYAS